MLKGVYTVRGTGTGAYIICCNGVGALNIPGSYNKRTISFDDNRDRFSRETIHIALKTQRIVIAVEYSTFWSFG